MGWRGLIIGVALCVGCAHTANSEQGSQKQQLSIAKCRSDAAAWNREEDLGPSDKDVGYQLSYSDLLARQGEMISCGHLEGQHGADGELIRVRDSYLALTRIYTTALMARYSHFIERHGLMEKFVEDDENGLR